MNSIAERACKEGGQVTRDAADRLTASPNRGHRGRGGGQRYGAARRRAAVGGAVSTSTSWNNAKESTEGGAAGSLASWSLRHKPYARADTGRGRATRGHAHPARSGAREPSPSPVESAETALAWTTVASPPITTSLAMTTPCNTTSAMFCRGRAEAPHPPAVTAVASAVRTQAHREISRSRARERHSVRHSRSVAVREATRRAGA